MKTFVSLGFIVFCSLLACVASLECYNCQSQGSHKVKDDCSKNGELVTCAGDESCIRYEINLVGNASWIIMHEGCLKSSLCSAFSKGEIEYCINLKKEGFAEECKAMCCNEDRCNSVSVLQISVLVLLLGILIAAVSN
ncbi:PREDICTED: uncharacterized protein LOC107339764 [Acropora digitifera]|uniref:uncharacterized protein LOC107339764 n=1 Tax=Acropora digitifera TaxID=70779 RepID=UPI00077A337E|nr:PREDICTED: uncharacterized protein LOC107339764 [Acropora digitifera]